MTLTKFNLKHLNIPYDAFICNNVNCTDGAHISAINLFYANIIESMKNASDELVSRPGRTKPYKRRPGRNARDLNAAARECSIMWIDGGKPKHGPVFDLEDIKGKV